MDFLIVNSSSVNHEFVLIFSVGVKVQMVHVDHIQKCCCQHASVLTHSHVLRVCKD